MVQEQQTLSLLPFAVVSHPDHSGFDEHGRRIPYEGMRVHDFAWQDYFRMQQPDINSAAVYQASCVYAGVETFPFSAKDFEGRWKEVLQAIQANPKTANLAHAVHVPFICPRVDESLSRQQDILASLAGVKQAFLGRFPEGVYKHFNETRPSQDIRIALESRYLTFENLRKSGHVVGVYFPNCLSGFDVPSQRDQTRTLPYVLQLSRGQRAFIVLSGIVDAAAAIMGTPELLFQEVNKTSYPHHLCCSALTEPEEPTVYTFEHYAQGVLWFMGRNRLLTPTQEQLSEQWAGGLTVFTVLES